MLENARTAKLIGSSLEAKVFLHASDNSMVTRLVDMCASENDADALQRIFLTSQVYQITAQNGSYIKFVSAVIAFLNVRGKVITYFSHN